MIYNIFFQQLLFALLALLIIYVTGKIIASLFEIRGNSFFRLFVTYIIGITAIIIFYSIIKSHGRTVNILLLPIIGYILYYFRNSLTKKPRLYKDEIIQEFTWSLIPFALIFLFQSWFYFNIKEHIICSIFSDIYTYADISNSLKIYGIENGSIELNFFRASNQSLVPYHYPELWITAFFSSLFNNSTVNSYYLCTMTILITIYLIGIVSLLNEFIKNVFLKFLLCVPLLFIAEINIPIHLPYISFQNNVWAITDVLGQKLAFTYIFLLFAIYNITKNNINIGLLIMSIIPIFSVGYLPGIWGGLTLFGIYLFFFNPRKNIKRIAIGGLIQLYLIVSYLIFYRINTSTSINSVQSVAFSEGIFKGFNGEITYLNLKIIFANFVMYSIPTSFIHLINRLISYLIFVPILYPILKNNKNALILLIFISICGCTFASLASSYGDSIQFALVLNSLYNIFIAILLIEVFKQNKIHCYLLFFIGICLIATNFQNLLQNKSMTSNEDMKFIKKCANIIRDDKAVILTFLSSKELEGNASFYLWKPDNGINSISQFSNKTFIFALGNPELFLHKKNITKTDLYFYNTLTPVTIWRNSGKNHDLKSFIKHFNITRMLYYCFMLSIHLFTFLTLFRNYFNLRSL